MKIDLASGSPTAVSADWLLLPVGEDLPLLQGGQAVDAALGGAFTRLRETGDVAGKLGELTRLLEAPGLAARRVLLVGLGTVASLTPAQVHRAILTAVRDIGTKAGRSVAFALPTAADGLPLSVDEFARIATVAAHVGSASPQLYRGQPDRHPLERIVFVHSPGESAAVAGAVAQGNILGEAVNLTRELVNRHPGEVYPETFADRAAQVAIEVGLACEVLDEHRLAQERMQALLAVARGSARPPRMVVLEYRGAGNAAAPLALVGKGVTFDSGGLSLKPTDGMKSMKADMAGAATVLGAMAAIARLKLPLNVVGLMGLVENMPGGAAYKLGEVLRARNGVTIEVLNTDAEGRLVLADVLSYAVDQGAGRIVDLATLTGSCVVALGEQVAGAFTNHQPWCDAVLAAARRAGEDVWQMPMFDSYAEQLKSDVADCKNVGTRWGGAITAAKFLEKFVGQTPWVHLDIAGPAFAETPQPHLDSGGTGVMVRTLVELAAIP
jgi:leucyl aminopeptidase